MTGGGKGTALETPKKEKLWTRDFIIVMFACSGISFCNYFFVPTLPIYAEKLTGTAVYAGLMTTIYTFAALATRPIVGALTEKVGRVKLLVFGAALCAAACLLYQFSTVIVLLIVIRAFHGLGFGVHTTAGGAVPADIVPKSRLAEGLGYFGLYGTIAAALGPGIALSIIGDGDFKSFMPLFYLASGVSLVCMVFDLCIRYEKRKKAEKGMVLQAEASAPCDETPLPKTFLGFEAGVVLPAIVLILVFIGFSSLTSFLSLYAAKKNLGNIGLFFTFSAAGMFLSRLLLGKIADRRGVDVVVIPGLIAVVFFFAVIPFIHNLVFLYCLAFPIGLAQGAIMPSINTMMFRRCSAKRRGSVSAAYFSSLDIGYGVGAFLFGAVADWLGFDFVYWGAALFALTGAVVYLVFLRRRKSLNKEPV